MKRKLILLTIGVMILGLLIGVDLVRKNQDTRTLEESYVGTGDKITRAETARLLSLLKYTKEELAAMERVITYEDTSEDYWYDKYINGAYTMDLLDVDHSAGKNVYRPMSFYTFADCKTLIDLFCVKQGEEKGSNVYQSLNDKLAELQGEEKETTDIRPEAFMELYVLLYQQMNGEKPVEKELYFLASYERNEKLTPYETVTNEGRYHGDGLNFAQYIEQIHRVYVKGDEILCVTDKIHGQSMIPNVFLVKKGDRDLRIFTSGVTIKLSLSGTIADDIDGQVADLTIEEGEVTGVSVKPDRITGKVLAVTEDYIEIENYGKREMAENFRGYKIYGDLAMANQNSLLIGYDNAEFVIAGDTICAVLITREIVAENIRVLLKTTGFKDYGHDKIVITSKKGFTVRNGIEEKSYKGGKSLTLKPGSGWLKNGRVVIKSKGKDGTLTVKSIKRNSIYPSYQGTLEVSEEDNGLLLVNELSLEQYLYGVVPSEMPASYGVEALKVQAVCARTYAYRQLMENGMKNYGAHVDDSSSYQVYNNTVTEKKAKKAVDATRGEILKYDGEIINAYYFSTSCGHTADAAEVWNGSASLQYLKGTLQSVKKQKDADYSEEKKFEEFINEDTVETYDSESPWYRWRVYLSTKKLKKNIDANLRGRYDANPELIQTKQKDGSFASVPVDTVGDVESIQIEEREKSGIITKLLITGSKHTVRVFTEYNIRILLAPVSGDIIRQDNSKVKGLSMLPSAFFYLKEKEKKGKVVGYTFYGGGYGHGVGLSQNGAKAMIDQGKTYDEVLKHYYAGIEIGKVY